MSRIEEALKKVANKRAIADSAESVSPAESHGPAAAQGRRKPDSSIKRDASELLKTVPIKITNLLLATARDDENVVVEEYNKLRSSLISLTKGEQFHNTILVTSTVSSEGKSMTALNLAISLAKEHDHTVLLVDTDLRRPSVHKFLDINPEYGLTHCLRDNLPLEKALFKTGVGKMVVLPAGEAIKDPVDLLSSRRMREIIQELKERYPDRYILFDSPPALPFADASVLAENLDATLFVVREGQANLRDIERTLAEFKEHNLLGVVYNDTSTFLKKSSYYYY